MVIDTDRARAKARSKAEIAKILRRLTLDDRADVLADLTIAVEDSETTTAATQTGSGRPPRKPGRPRGSATASGGTSTATLLGLLKPGNKLSISQMADKLYGSHDDRPRNNVRSLLANLKRRELVQRIGPGRWEVLPKKG